MRLSAAITALALSFTCSLALAQTTPAALKLQPDISNPAIPLPHDENNNPIYAACLVSLKVNKDGNPEKIHIGICADDRIKAYITASAAQFTFVPAMNKGKAVSSDIKFVATPHYPGDAITGDSNPMDPGKDKSFFANNGIKPPVAVYTPEAMYPSSAMDQKQNGKVDVNVNVTKYGTVKDAHVVKSAGNDFDQCALDAIQTWLFKPAIRDGKPLAVRITIEVAFSIF